MEYKYTKEVNVEPTIKLRIEEVYMVVGQGMTVFGEVETIGSF